MQSLQTVYNVPVSWNVAMIRVKYYQMWAEFVKVTA